MRIRCHSTVRRLAFAGLFCALAIACAARPELLAPDEDTRPIEIEIVRLINEHRRVRSLPALRDDPLLAALARGHSGTMARDGAPSDHDGFRGRFHRASATLPLTSFAENVARMHVKRPRPASWVVSSWLESQVHREHIEGPFGLTGIGVVRSAKGDFYFTQIFAETAGRP
jgi:uncharacterized protein YkwD